MMCDCGFVVLNDRAWVPVWVDSGSGSGLGLSYERNEISVALCSGLSAMSKF